MTPRSAVAYEFEQVAVGVEEVHAIVIAPVDWPRTLDASFSQALARVFEIGAAHAEGVMPSAERMRNALVALFGRELRTLDLEQGEILGSTLEQRLVAEMGNDSQSQHLGIESLGLRELVNFNSKMVEPFKLHRVILLTLG